MTKHHDNLFVYDDFDDDDNVMHTLPIGMCG